MLLTYLLLENGREGREERADGKRGEGNTPKDKEHRINTVSVDLLSTIHVK